MEDFKLHSPHLIDTRSISIRFSMSHLELLGQSRSSVAPPRIDPTRRPQIVVVVCLSKVKTFI